MRLRLAAGIQLGNGVKKLLIVIWDLFRKRGPFIAARLKMAECSFFEFEPLRIFVAIDPSRLYLDPLILLPHTLSRHHQQQRYRCKKQGYPSQHSATHADPQLREQRWPCQR